MLPSALLALITLSVPAMSLEEPRFLALGDSYTIGEGVAERERWPLQLVAALRAKGIQIGDPQIIARTGWTTDELSAAIDAETLRPPYQLVTLLIGVNNQYRGRTADEYRNEFSGLLKRAIELAGGRPQHVIVLAIPDWGVTAFGRGSGRDLAKVAAQLDAYNAINREIAAKEKVRYVDIAPTARAGGDRVDMLTADGLHPSAAMYAQWSALVLPEACAALSN